MFVPDFVVFDLMLLGGWVMVLFNDLVAMRVYLLVILSVCVCDYFWGGLFMVVIVVLDLGFCLCSWYLVLSLLLFVWVYTWCYFAVLFCFGCCVACNVLCVFMLLLWFWCYLALDCLFAYFGLVFDVSDLGVVLVFIRFACLWPV